MENGQIMATSDGGNTWQSQYNDAIGTPMMKYIKMFDLKNGVAMGDGWGSNRPTILRTTDGGVHWISINTSALPNMFSGDSWRRIDYPSMSVGYFYTSIGFIDFPQRIYKTTDGGATWNPVFYGRVECLRFYDERIGIAGFDSYGMNLYRTFDGGATWDTLQFANYPDSQWKGHANDYRFLPGDPSKIWHTDELGLWFSSDTGRTWRQQQLDAYSVVGQALVFTDASHGWLLAGNGLLYRTNNGDHITSVDQSKAEMPTECQLEQNYPNPFNPSTTIRYGLPKSANVSLKIFNALGQEVVVLVNERKDAGSYSVHWNANVPSGIYFYRLQAGDFMETKKMILIR